MLRNVWFQLGRKTEKEKETNIWSVKGKKNGKEKRRKYFKKSRKTYFVHSDEEM